MKKTNQVLVLKLFIFKYLLTGEKNKQNTNATTTGLETYEEFLTPSK